MNKTIAKFVISDGLNGSRIYLPLAALNRESVGTISSVHRCYINYKTLDDTDHLIAKSETNKTEEVCD